MKPVNQTIFERETGNCYAACIASILELELADVPNFSELSNGRMGSQLEEAQKWLLQFGLTILRLKMPQFDGESVTLISPIFNLAPLLTGGMCIASVPSKVNEGGKHAVICDFYNGLHLRVIHCPNPNVIDKEYTEPFQLDFIIPIDPAASIRASRLSTAAIEAARSVSDGIKANRPGADFQERNRAFYNMPKFYFALTDDPADKNFTEADDMAWSRTEGKFQFVGTAGIDVSDYICVVRHLSKALPEGFEIVTEGMTAYGDRCWNKELGWRDVEQYPVPIDPYHCVIRRK